VLNRGGLGLRLRIQGQNRLFQVWARHAGWRGGCRRGARWTAAGGRLGAAKEIETEQRIAWLVSLRLRGL